MSHWQAFVSRLGLFPNITFGGKVRFPGSRLLTHFLGMKMQVQTSMKPDHALQRDALVVATKRRLPRRP